MNREYIKVPKPSPLPSTIANLKKLDDDFWKKLVFRHLLLFYQDYDEIELKEKIANERKTKFPRVEREIAKFLRNKLNNSRVFSSHFQAFGENTNDENIEGNYDITIHNTYWKSKNFYFECKNLNESQDLVNKYVCCKIYKKNTNDNYIFDGGVLRYFNGKYAQNLNFGGMIGFVLEGDVSSIKSKILKKLEEKFNTTPDGDLINIIDNSIEQNDFTFDSYHKRFNSEFLIHHLLFNFS